MRPVALLAMTALIPDPTQLECSLPVARHPRTDDLCVSAHRWLSRFFRVESDQMARQLEVASFHALAGMSAPDVSFATLERIYRWYLWLFLVDDVTDPAQYAQGVGPLLDLHGSMHPILDGRRPDRDAPGVAKVLHALLDDYAQHGDLAYLPKLISDTRRYLEGNAWEAHLRQHGVEPSSSAYADLRPDAGATYTAFDLFPLLDERYRLGLEELEHLGIRSQRTFAALHISWVNDVHGYERELAEGNPSNLVSVIAHEQGIAPRVARAVAVSRCNATLKDFMAAREAWLALAPDASPQAHAYVTMMEQWIAGSLAWHRMSGRYRTQHALCVGQHA